MKSKELLSDLEAEGWVVVRVKGSHHHLQHPERPGTITIPHPKKELGVGLVRAIKKQAGLL